MLSSFTTNPGITINFSSQDQRAKKQVRLPNDEASGNKGLTTELLVYNGQEVCTLFFFSNYLLLTYN